MKNKNLLIFRISTALLTMLMLLSAGMYLFNYEMVSETYINIGFPTFIIYPLAIAKILGLVAIWTNKSKTLKEWAYAGFAYDLILAVGAHVNVNDGEYFGAVIGLLILAVSYYADKKVNAEPVAA
ncbi:DoxX family protein [Aureibacter tunicatorum]|uniref:Membrane-anchored protein n=1 Tax=Aureibacter tunicatorum TaxID=866807 RepID=A0AAE3XL86_9BACT|nr:DoxX family protein [Aureibacter tunicatorum]MDR6238507.1 putative membrane-anchored protein [Aureibacter tunicatorum]BDD05560.1 hypothetical protein AUTU_30430 [Aureibacter tunicatorum]